MALSASFSAGSRRDYSAVTETPGDQITAEAARMVVSRYDLVRRMADGKRVLEVACGSGQGLGFVGKRAASVVGGDITFRSLQSARRHYGNRHPVIQFDAHNLPFRDGAFDIVQLHEAVYYLTPHQAFAECRRVLTAGGVLVVSSINPTWTDFNPSPAATKYFAIEELKQALQHSFATVELFSGFPVSLTGSGRLISALKRAAVWLGVIPRSMKGKRLLKRLFLGSLITVPAEITDAFAPVDEPEPFAAGPSSQFKIIYAIATA